MNVKKLNEAIEVLKEDLGNALLACDIWLTGTGQSIAGYNSNPQATALFERVTEFMTKALKGAGFPGLKDYYLLDLEGDNVVVVMQLKNNYQWGMLVDGKKVQLGLLLNIALPNARRAFEEAL